MIIRSTGWICALFVTFSSAVINTTLCGTTIGCLFAPPGCSPPNCRFSFSYTVDDQFLNMELSGTPPQANGYLAVGFSRDQEMGDDSLSYCMVNNGQNTAGLGYTQGRSVEMVQSSMQTTQQFSASNGQIDCILRRQISNTGNVQIFDLNNTFTVFLAMGPIEDGAISYHGNNKWVMPRTEMARYGRDTSGTTISSTSSPVSISDAPRPTADKLKIAHGILMILSWSIFFATGILFARHFKGHFPNTTICGIKLWFHFHRTLNMIGVAATICAFVCIFVSKDWRWTGPKAYQSAELNREWGSVHSMLGLLACVVAWSQPLNAVFRCSPDAKPRIIFNWIHRFFGVAAWLMAAAAIMIACVHFPAMFSNRDAALGLYIAYIAVIGLTLIAMEVLSIKTWLSKRRGGSGNTEMEMVRIGGRTGVAISDHDQKIQRLQCGVLVVFLTLAIGISTAISVLIGLKPIKY